MIQSVRLRARLPNVPLTEPDLARRLRDETELLSFTVTGHPLEQFPDVAWDTYCPIRDLARGSRCAASSSLIARTIKSPATR